MNFSCLKSCWWVRGQWWRSAHWGSGRGTPRGAALLTWNSSSFHLRTMPRGFSSLGAANSTQAQSVLGRCLCQDNGRLKTMDPRLRYDLQEKAGQGARVGWGGVCLLHQ